MNGTEIVEWAKGFGCGVSILDTDWFAQEFAADDRSALSVPAALGGQSHPDLGPRAFGGLHPPKSWESTRRTDMSTLVSVFEWTTNATHLKDDADHLSMQCRTSPCWMDLGFGHAVGTDTAVELS